jgi:hypothetical protein
MGTTTKYKFVEKKDTIAIQIEEGKYKGVIYNYGKVQFNGEVDPPSMNFQYKILKSPPDVVEDSDFNDILGDILVDIIEEQLEQGEVVYAGGTD